MIRKLIESTSSAWIKESIFLHQIVVNGICTTKKKGIEEEWWMKNHVAFIIITYWTDLVICRYQNYHYIYQSKKKNICCWHKLEHNSGDGMAHMWNDRIQYTIQLNGWNRKNCFLLINNNHKNNIVSISRSQSALQLTILFSVIVELRLLFSLSWDHFYVATSGTWNRVHTDHYELSNWSRFFSCCVMFLFFRLTLELVQFKIERQPV